jgi:hypothetical protein
MFLEDDLQDAVVDMYNYVIGNPQKPLAFHPLWDLHPKSWDLVANHSKFRYLKIDDGIHLIGLRDKPLHLKFYVLVIPKASTVLQIFRENPTGILAIARSLLTWGIPFLTVKCHAHQTIGFGSMGMESVGLNFRHHGYRFGSAEYAIYEKKKRDILEGRYGRVAAMSGGILWRLAKDIVDNKRADSVVHAGGYSGGSLRGFLPCRRPIVTHRGRHPMWSLSHVWYDSVSAC